MPHTIIGRMILSAVRTLPVPVCGLALGLAALDRLIGLNYFGTYVFALISAAIIILFTLRAAADRGGLRKEMEDPATAGILPAYCMTLMIFSAPVAGVSLIAGQLLWISAVILSFVIMAYFLIKFIPKGINSIFPSTFVIFVGYAAGSVTSPDVGLEHIGRLLIIPGIAGYFTILVLALYRIAKRGIPRAAVPSMAIFAAPANLCIAGYLSSYAEVNETILMIMAVLAVCGYAAVLAGMPVMLRTEFGPGFAAFTFPMVISSVSLHMMFSHYGINGTFADALLAASAIFAAIITVCVLAGYVILIRSRIRALRS